VFEIGSISKVFTATVLAELVLDGKVHLDDPAQEYVPATVHLPIRDGKVITLANLSEQNSGLPRMPTNFHPALAGAGAIRSTTTDMLRFLGFEPSRKVGVIIMTNSGGAGADDIGFHLLDPALPLTPAPTRRTAITLPADVLAPYVGTDQLAPNFSLDVTLSNGALYVHPTGQLTFQLWPESETEFFLKEVDAQLTFVRDALGAVTGAVLHQNGRDMPARKVP
jgi:hypothetical protein